MQEGVEGSVIRPADADVAAQAVARAAGDEAEQHRRVHEGGGHLVHRAVTADGHDQTAALAHRSGRQLGAVTGSQGVNHGGVEASLLDEGSGPEPKMGVAPVVPGVGVEDEPGFHRRVEWERVGEDLVK